VKGTVTNAFSSGRKEVFQLTFASGRSIDASANHPFLTIDGWRRVDSLEAGVHLATARRYPSTPVEQTMTDHELVLLGHLIGDGCTLARHAIQYTTTDPANVHAVVNAARNAFGIEARVKPERSWTQVYLPSPHRLTHGRSHPISAWMRSLDAWDRRAWEKKIPASVFAQPPDALALFLRHLWATDGSTAHAIYYATTSRELAQGVQDLLLRLNIRSRLRSTVAPQGRPQFAVEVSGRANQLRFAEMVGVHGARQEQLTALVDRIRPNRENTNVDIIPRAIWDHVRRSTLPAASLTARQLADGLGMSYCGSTLYKHGVSRERMQRLADVTSDSRLADLAVSDVFWDRLISIESLGEMEVFDATVEPHHNFVANGVVAHNSLEQDADVVMFLYRDEVYNSESPDKGSAEILIAKHRSGPIGMKRLAFLGAYTRFENMARGV
jgi:replicative DNA helicase